MKNIALFSVFTFLVACGGGGGSSSPAPAAGPEANSVTVSSTGSTSSIDEQGEYSLTIDGTGNTLTIEGNNTISALEISGTGNTIEVKNKTTVSNFTVSGTGNTILVPIDSGITFIDSGTGNVLKTTTTNSIVGTWKYTYPATQCVETYEFNSDGTVNETSLDEVAAGTYTFEETVITGDRHLLSITFTSDNGLADCNGLSKDDTGLNFSPYIKFTSAVVTEWFNDAVGGSPIVVLTKQ